jgi:CspA family cold shock protein
VATGTVKWFNRAMRYGFIRPDDGSASVFVPLASVEAAGLKDLNDGQRVSYELVRAANKHVAEGLQLIG